MKEPGTNRAERAKAHERAGGPQGAAPAGMESRGAPRRRVIWITSIGIFALTTGLVAFTANDLGLTWDEPPYRHSQVRMARWFRELARSRSVEAARPLLSKSAILEAWEYNRFGPNFHPPLAGMLCNFTHAVFGNVLGDLPSRRLASGAELGLAAAVLFMFLARRYSLWVGGVAAASLLLMPRVFGHANIAGTDLPLMAFWSFAALAFWKGLDSLVWRVVFGILLGLSLLVKFTAILMVVPLGAWLLIYRVSPNWSVGLVVRAMLATVFVAGPLVLAGAEIVRLSQGIREHTQRERMLRPAIEGLAAQLLHDEIRSGPPFARDAMNNGVRSLVERLENQPAATLQLQVARALATAVEESSESSPVEPLEFQAILERTSRTFLTQSLEHAAPYSEAEMKRVSLQLLEELALLRGRNLQELIGHSAPYTARELKHAAATLGMPPLALDQYVAYVMPKENLGVATRIPGWIFFLPLLIWTLWHLISALPVVPAVLRAPVGGLDAWLAGLAIAPAVAIALNPTWWHETLPQLGHFYQITVGRQGSLPDIEIFYLGNKYIYSLPWHNGWLLIAVTVPVAILISSLAGIGSAVWRCKQDPLRVYFVLQLLVLPLSRMLPTPAHDGVRLMLPTFFFLAALAGLGFEWIERLVDRLRSEEHSTVPVLFVAALFLLGPPAYWLLRAHPYELSYYNGLVGGLPGAQRLGFEPTYWYDAVNRAVVSDLNDPERGVPHRAVLSLPEPQSIIEATTFPGMERVALLRALPERRINPEVFVEMWATRVLRQDIRITDIRGVPPEPNEFPYVALLTHSSKASPFTRILYACTPHTISSHDGVRLFSLYAPRGVARAWALWLLIDATDYSQPDLHPRVDTELIELARVNYRALYAAALRVTEQGLDKTLETEQDDATRMVLRRLAARRPYLDLLMARRKESLIEAVEIISRVAEKRPQLLKLIVEDYEGYLPASRLGDYLDLNQPDAGTAR